MEFFSYLGGYSGVWLGFSLLTVYELIEILFCTARPASYTADHLKSRKTFKGCVTRRPRVRRPRNVERKVQPEDVLAYALAYPQSSTKMISENYGLSNSRVWTTLIESGADPHLCRDCSQEMLREVTRGATL
ncbi:hypothetical protein AVEN_255820-1 [Araneus ventricosus]|uniref:DUF4817 domain-containing protein n=1 Tax=Araneus ventricosus TaxID=182803 RepID=A0A4Y2RVS1_ARAVE|nr:hypothetical protein AVEN_255820-1 [Araneus ventricosus]